jgi:hypothetical protein
LLGLGDGAMQVDGGTCCQGQQGQPGEQQLAAAQGG